LLSVAGLAVVADGVIDGDLAAGAGGGPAGSGEVEGVLIHGAQVSSVRAKLTEKNLEDSCSRRPRLSDLLDMVFL
jgi:hypothetical protein